MTEKEKEKEAIKLSEKKWKVIYPINIDGGRSLREGRKVPKSVAIDKPRANEMASLCKFLGIDFKYEKERCHPRDVLNPGRVLVNLKTSSKPSKIELPIKKKALLKEICSKFTKLKTRNPKKK